MPEADKKAKEPENKEITFKCKSCGETRPLSELIVMRHLHPQMAVCKACARSSRTQSDQNPQSS